MQHIFTLPAFRHYWLSRFLVSMGLQIVVVAIGWHIYDLTRDPFNLGLVGLVQFLPVLFLVPFTGTVADRFDRRRVFGAASAIVLLVTLALWFVVAGQFRHLALIYGLFLLFGIARAFIGPAIQALLPALVPTELLAQAVAWNSTAWQTALILGPIAGGVLYDLGIHAPFAVATGFFIAGLICIVRLPKVHQKPLMTENGWQRLMGGFAYIRRENIVLGAITLDLFAVLLGGVVALMPVFARDILVLGPMGLGLLRAAPGIGAVSMAVWLSIHPIRSHAGIKMFAAVIVFGLATIIFGMSDHLVLSMLALVLLGASDMISVNIRQTLVQLWTPDHLRGRVNAVNSLSVGASNELGEFRAGTMAAWIGAPAAVIVGGLGSVAVALIWAWRFPSLRQASHLDGRT